MSHHLSPKTQACIDACQKCTTACEHCATACEHCATACLLEDDVQMMARCILLDRSCADICSFAVREMARGSDFATEICLICADVCQACGDECAKHQKDHCQECAKACHACATACHQMAALAV